MRRAFPRARRAFRTGRTVAYRVAGKTTLVGIRAGRVRYIVVFDPRSIKDMRAAADYVRRA
jgi:3-deoxy-D-arabino-heptulosonate 7-phosphate (DAHP) synthase